MEAKCFFIAKQVSVGRRYKKAFGACVCFFFVCKNCIQHTNSKSYMHFSLSFITWNSKGNV